MRRSSPITACGRLVLVTLLLSSGCAKQGAAAPSVARESELPGAYAKRLDALQQAIPAPIDTPECAAARLVAMKEIDQTARSWFDELPEQYWEALREQALRIDADNLVSLKAIVARHGWPTAETFGKEASFAAWLLAQHADEDPAFQRQVLDTVTPMLGEGGVRGQDYALLFDRVALAEGRLQRFGSQGGCQGQSFEPHPLESGDSVDALRSELGMPPLASYVAWASAFLCGAEPMLQSDEPDPCEGLDVVALGEQGYSPGMEVMMNTSDGPLPIGFQDESRFLEFLTGCQ